MRYFFLPLLLLFANLSFGQNPDTTFTEIEKQQAIALAEFWTVELTKGENVDTLLAITKLPFGADNKKIIGNKKDLLAYFEHIWEDKGKRTCTIKNADIVAENSEILQEVFVARYLVVKVICVMKEKEFLIAISIEMSGKPMVAGFRD